MSIHAVPMPAALLTTNHSVRRQTTEGNDTSTARHWRWDKSINTKPARVCTDGWLTARSQRCLGFSSSRKSGCQRSIKRTCVDGASHSDVFGEHLNTLVERCQFRVRAYVSCRSVRVSGVYPGSAVSNADPGDTAAPDDRTHIDVTRDTVTAAGREPPQVRSRRQGRRQGQGHRQAPDPPVRRCRKAVR